MSGSWASLNRELNAWAMTGREALFWWRDDDATAYSRDLMLLLDLAALTGAPLSLAVIPAEVEPGLDRALRIHEADCSVLQHGFAHRNHAGPGAKKCELVSLAERPESLEELCRGRARLEALFGACFRPVLVPPWNRIAVDLVAALPGLGFTGLSTYKPRPSAAPAPGLVQVNCHLDILQWRPERRFLGEAAALELLTGHLAAKRQGRADAAEPSGILSHHRAHDVAAWDFLERLMLRLVEHPGARVLPAEAVFAP